MASVYTNEGLFRRRSCHYWTGEGRKLYDVNGNEYWDGVSSIWLNVHGHQVPELDEAIREQLNKISHSTMLGLANVPSILLAEK